jgi:hypothetical protein
VQRRVLTHLASITQHLHQQQMRAFHVHGGHAYS